MTRLAPVNQVVPLDIAPTVDRVLAENLRLRAWLPVIANCKTENTTEERYARRVRYITTRALQGDKP